MYNKPPKNWKRVTLGELLDYERPDKYIVSSEDYSDSYKTPVLTAGKTFILGYTNDTEGIYKNLPVIIFDDFTTESKYVDFDFKVKSSAMKILKAENNITLKYLYYLMQTLSFNHDTHKRYWISEYSKLKIDIPDKIEEQQEIVQVLDTMSNIIRLREECISHAQDLIPALFQEMFDNPQTNKKNWQICCLKDLAKIDRQNISPEELKTKQYTYIGLEHIEKETGRILVDPNSQQDIDLKSNKFFFTNNHVLYGKLRPYLNKVALPDFDGVCSTDIFPLLPLEGISNKYFLKVLMNTSYFVNIANSQSSGANLPRIGTTALENIKVFKPDYTLQEQFAQKVIEIEAYIKEQQEELANAKQMFQSLLHHAFTGELTRRAYGKI